MARRRVVLFNWDPAAQADSWLVRDYLHGFERLVPPGYAIEQTLERLGGGRIEPVPVPHDCRDGFLHAYWRRPRAYLDPQVRAGISAFHLLPAAEVAEAIERLRVDLDSGRVGAAQRGAARARGARPRLSPGGDRGRHGHLKRQRPVERGAGV